MSLIKTPSFVLIGKESQVWDGLRCGNKRSYNESVFELKSNVGDAWQALDFDAKLRRHHLKIDLKCFETQMDSSIYSAEIFYSEYTLYRQDRDWIIETVGEF